MSKKIYKLSEEGEAELARCFDYHAPGAEDRAKYEQLTAAMRTAARTIYATCPRGPDRTAALTALRSARMWANASIACKDAP